MPKLLKLHSAEEAKELFFAALGSSFYRTEMIDSLLLVGRILAEPIIAREYLPAFSRSSMDGVAVQAVDTIGASEKLPGHLKLMAEVPMGKTADFILERGQAALIHTGGMISEGADAVVILEESRVTDQGELEAFTPVSKGENVILKGEDVQPGDEVLPAGKKIRAVEVGGLLALWHTRVKVTKKPYFGILSSGDEVIPPDQTSKPGQVRDINRGDLAALLLQNGADVQTYDIIPDNREQMERSIRLAFNENDAVVITAGSSASSQDLTAEVI